MQQEFLIPIHRVSPSPFPPYIPPRSSSSSLSITDLQDNEHRPSLDFGPVQNDPRCGLSVSERRVDVAQRRIVGGDEAGFGSFPWQAYIRIGKKMFLFEGIVLILTASFLQAPPAAAALW